MNPKKERYKVLFLDDEGEWSGPYIAFLSETCDVVPFRDVSAAIEYLQTNLDVMAVVADIMMPTPDNVSRSLTHDGELTGVWFLSQIKDYIVGAKCPVVVLTNKSLSTFREAIDKLEVPPTLIECRQKRDTPRNLLPTIVAHMILRAQPK